MEITICHRHLSPMQPLQETGRILENRIGVDRSSHMVSTLIAIKTHSVADKYVSKVQDGL